MGLGGDVWRCYRRGGGDGKNSICAKGLGSIAGQWEFPLSSEPISQCQKQERKKPPRKYKQIIFQQTAKRTKISWRGKHRRLGLRERKALIQSALHSYISWIFRRQRHPGSSASEAVPPASGHLPVPWQRRTALCSNVDVWYTTKCLVASQKEIFPFIPVTPFLVPTLSRCILFFSSPKLFLEMEKDRLEGKREILAVLSEREQVFAWKGGNRRKRRI